MATIRPGSAVPGAIDTIEFIALPFDALGILDSLTAAADPPPPAFPELEAELTAYTRPNPAAAEDIHTRWVEARDRVRALSDSLHRLDRDVAPYRRLYARFRTEYDRLVEREAALERALIDLSAGDVALAERATAAADLLRTWEIGALSALDSILDARLAEAGRPEHAVPGAEPDFELHLEPGPWWLTARVPHPDNPFLEYVWNVPFTVNRLVPVVVPMTERHVTLQWRH